MVVQAKLNDLGSVTDASAIFGHPMLIPGCVEDVKKWRFRPNSEGLAVVIYHFNFITEGFRYNSDHQRQFVFEQPNFVTITGTPMVFETESSDRAFEHFPQTH